MNMEQALSAEGVLQFTYRETHRTIAQFVEKILTEYDMDGRRAPVPPLAAILDLHR